MFLHGPIQLFQLVAWIDGKSFLWQTYQCSSERLLLRSYNSVSTYNNSTTTKPKLSVTSTTANLTGKQTTTPTAHTSYTWHNARFLLTTRGNPGYYKCAAFLGSFTHLHEFHFYLHPHGGRYGETFEIVAINKLSYITKLTYWPEMPKYNDMAMRQRCMSVIYACSRDPLKVWAT